MTTRVHCKKAKFDVYIGRPSEWGNPYSHKDGTLARHRVESRHDAVQRFREDVANNPEFQETIRRELTGKVLGCWCGDGEECHGDVYIEICDKESNGIGGTSSKE